MNATEKIKDYFENHKQDLIDLVKDLNDKFYCYNDLYFFKNNETITYMLKNLKTDNSNVKEGEYIRFYKNEIQILTSEEYFDFLMKNIDTIIEDLLNENTCCDIDEINKIIKKGKILWCPNCKDYIEEIYIYRKKVTKEDFEIRSTSDDIRLDNTDVETDEDEIEEMYCLRCDKELTGEQYEYFEDKLKD